MARFGSYDQLVQSLFDGKPNPDVVATAPRAIAALARHGGLTPSTRAGCQTLRRLRRLGPTPKE